MGRGYLEQERMIIQGVDYDVGASIDLRNAPAIQHINTSETRKRGANPLNFANKLKI
jgi:hypothetical protein